MYFKKIKINETKTNPFTYENFAILWSNPSLRRPKKSFLKYNPTCSLHPRNLS